MLVSRLRRTPACDSEAGSTLISVLVIMLVLAIGGMTLAVIVTNTTGVLVDSRSTAQSRAAADAGLADAVSLARRGGGLCGLTLNDDLPTPGTSAVPEYDVVSTCDPGSSTVTFSSVGRAGTGETTVEATYNYVTSTVGHGADMVFYSDTTFTSEVITSNGSNGLLSIVIPSGGFTCQVHVPANIITSGDVETNGSCTIDGNVRAGGQVSMTNMTDVIKGNATASATTTANLQGRILGNVALGGGISVGGSSFTFPGAVSVRGNVKLAKASLAGALTIPKANQVEYDGWLTIKHPTATSPRVAGGIVWQDAVPAPAKPTFDPWFDYAYKASDWQPYNGVMFDRIALVNSGDGPWTCNRFNANNPSTSGAAGWREVGALTHPTVIDATACTSLSSNNGSNPDVALGTDVVFVAKSFDLTTLRFTSRTGTTARVWYITNDGVTTGAGAGAPSCSNGAGNIGVNHTDMAGVIAMIYTPCTIRVQGNSKWRGAFYGGGFSYGGGMTFVGDNIALPGMPASDTLPGAGETTVTSLGQLVSRRDAP